MIAYDWKMMKIKIERKKNLWLHLAMKSACDFFLQFILINLFLLTFAEKNTVPQEIERWKK